MNSDNVKGKLKDIGGKAEEAIGRATGDPKLEAEGGAKQAEGKVQNAWGNVKKEARDLKEEVKGAINKKEADSNVEADKDINRRDDVA